MLILCINIFLDKGEPPRTGTATVRIYTLNKNDEPPKFSQQVNMNHLVADESIHEKYNQ